MNGYPNPARTAQAELQEHVKAYVDRFEPRRLPEPYEFDPESITLEDVEYAKRIFHRFDQGPMPSFSELDAAILIATSALSRERERLTKEFEEIQSHKGGY